MVELLSDLYDFSFLWTWLLLAARGIGLLLVLPAIGTQQVPAPVRMILAFIMALAIALSGVKAEMPENTIDILAVIGMEFVLGSLIATIPLMILSALSITGQVVSGTIGLGMANLIDPSIGQNVSMLSRVEVLLATALFVAIDGHHEVVRAMVGVDGTGQLGLFKPNMDLAMYFLHRFSESFDLAILCSAPILVSILLTQFVLGLITKSVPQVNIFIISLPLTIGMGLYITAFTFPGVIENLLADFSYLDEHIARIFDLGIPKEQ